MNPKIKPVVWFCISAALWAIPSYYLYGTLPGDLIFHIFGVVPAFFLQVCMFLPPIERWVRYVPIPGILGFGVIEIILLFWWDCFGGMALLRAFLFVMTPLSGFLLGWIYHAVKNRKPESR